MVSAVALMIPLLIGAASADDVPASDATELAFAEAETVLAESELVEAPTDEALMAELTWTAEEQAGSLDPFFEPIPEPMREGVDKLVLDWGTAEIGPGVLAPHGFETTGRGGAPGGGLGGGGASGAGILTSQPPIPPVIVSPEVPLSPDADPEVVPEPTSLAIWGLVLALLFATRSIRKRPPFREILT